jgi:hypothetical protein
MKIDFAHVKLIPIASVLAFYRVQVKKRSHKELVCKCPLPSHQVEKHKNDNETFCIGLEKNKWYCHSDSCRAIGNHPKGGDVIDLVCLLDGIDRTKPLPAATKISQLFALPSEGVGERLKNNLTASTPEPEATESNKPLAFALTRLDPMHPFIAERKITVETAKAFGVGFQDKGSMANRICFPLYESHREGDKLSMVLIGYAGRFAGKPPEGESKWKLPLGLHRTFLYNLERCVPGKSLYLVESPWACLWLYQHNLQAAALIGTSLSEAQEKLLEPFEHIRICMDNDAAGHEAAQKLWERLHERHTVHKAFLID